MGRRALPDDRTRPRGHRRSHCPSSGGFGVRAVPYGGSRGSGSRNQRRGEALFDELDEAYLDTVLAAKGSDRILLSDDGPFRILAAEAGSIKTVWTQAAVSFAAGQKKVLPETYFQVGNTL